MQGKSYHALFVAVGFVLVIVCGRATAGSVGDDLIGAARDGNTETVRALLAAGADVNAKDCDGVTALMATAALGYTETAKTLIAAEG